MLMKLQTDQRLLLDALCLDVVDARTAWRRWRELVDFEAMQQPGDRMALLPGLARRPEVIDGDAAAGRIAGLYRKSWTRNHLLWQAASSAVATLDAAGIPAVLHGGAGILDLMGDIGARPIDAVDLLVTADANDTALQRLHADGWTREALAVGGVRRFRPGFPVATLVTAGGGRLRLHIRALRRLLVGRAETGLWSAATPRDDEPGRKLHPADLLLQLLLHSGHAAVSDSVWVVDVDRLLSATTTPIAARLMSQASAAHAVLGCLDRLQFVADCVPGSKAAALCDALTDQRPDLIDRLRESRWNPRRLLP